MFEKIQWLFFDAGTTLIDETESFRHRIQETIQETKITYEAFIEKQIYFAKMKNTRGYEETLDYFGLPKMPYPKEYEVPFPNAKRTLQRLNAKNYRIGIIANQSQGTASRFEKWGLLQYIDLVIASAEEGVSKPNPGIFEIALQRAKCQPGNAVMIGDRLDNDIAPAKKLGIHTIWVKQGFSRYWSIKTDAEKPDCIVDDIEEVCDYF